MTVEFEGVVRTRSHRRFLFLTRDHWVSQRFRWEFDLLKDACGVYEQVTPTLQLAVDRTGERLVVKALVRGHAYILSDSRVDEEFSTTISVLSVAGIDVSGKLTHHPTLTVEAASDEFKQSQNYA